MMDPRMKLYCLFLKSNLKVFDTFNLYMQKDEPIIFQMRTKCIQLLTDLLVKFVAVAAFKKERNVFILDFKRLENQKEDHELSVGVETKEYLEAETSGLSDEQKEEFYKHVREYFVVACEYIIQKFPLQDQFLTHAEVTDVTRREHVSFTSVLYFIKKFKFRCQLDPDTIQTINDEFERYRIDELPQKVVEASRMDIKWHLLSETYPNLSKVMIGVLCVPHSNADSERVFSVSRHIDTDFRNMDCKTLESLVIVKTHLQNRDKCCYNEEFTEEFLVRAKKATYVGLQAAAHQEEEMCDPLDDVSGDVLRILSGEYPK